MAKFVVTGRRFNLLQAYKLCSGDSPTLLELKAAGAFGGYRSIHGAMLRMEKWDIVHIKRKVVRQIMTFTYRFNKEKLSMFGKFPTREEQKDTSAAP